MNKITPFLELQNYPQWGYCSQQQEPLPTTPRNSDQIVALIEKILHNTTLCHHNVQVINCLYHELNLLEKKLKQN